MLNPLSASQQLPLNCFIETYVSWDHLARKYFFFFISLLEANLSQALNLSSCNCKKNSFPDCQLAAVQPMHVEKEGLLFTRNEGPITSIRLACLSLFS